MKLKQTIASVALVGLFTLGTPLSFAQSPCGSGVKCPSGQVCEHGICVDKPIVAAVPLQEKLIPQVRILETTIKDEPLAKSPRRVNFPPISTILLG